MALDNVRLHIDQLRVGVPLPFDVFDAQGHPLLRKGVAVVDQEQLDRLIERGVYCSAADAEQFRRRAIHAAPATLPHIHHAAPRVVEKVSVFGLLGQVRDTLATLYATPAQGAAPDLLAVAGALPGLAELVQRACALDADAALASILVSRPPRYALRQMLNVAVLADVLLRQLGADPAERRSALCAALSMNLAMLTLQDALYHHEGPLNAAQQRAVEEHPARAVALLRGCGVGDAVWLAAVEQHHECFDGSGYPARLAGAAISRAAQVLGLADRYCALITERAARPGAYPNNALREIFTKHGHAIDPQLASTLIRELGIYPPGAVVVLANDELCVVVKRTLNANHPVVRALFTNNGKKYPVAPKRLTTKPVYAVKSVARREKLGDADLEALWSLAEAEVGDA